MRFPLRQLPREEFPELLREIPDAPKRLFARGELPRGREYLCVVGSRAMSPYGARMAHKLIAGLAGYPVAIVSGLALGIDAQAHKAALEAGLPAVAVLPSSADDESIYPSSNLPLARGILSASGALLSENEAPFRPAAYSFPQRNRVMAGMSRATLVIEAGEKSGTLITARLALEYNRDVLAIPHDLEREGGAGSNRLLKDGAALVRDSADIAEALGFAPLSKTEIAPADLSEHESKLLHALTQPLHAEDVIERSKLSAQEANIAISSLLIRGLIVERLGKIERA